LICRGVALIVRVAFHAQLKIGVLLYQLGDFTEDFFGIRLDRGFTSVEVNSVDRDMAGPIDFVAER